MKNIENRLSAVERIAAKTELVEVNFKDNAKGKEEMDLLKAVHLLLNGSIHTITAKWKPGEREKYQDAVIREIEDYVDAMAEEREIREQAYQDCDIYKKYKFKTGI